MLRVIELFGGVGCQTQALKNLGVPHKVVGVSEIDKYAIKSYQALHGDDIPQLGDICKIEQLPKADLWTYSFPCQDLSVAGKQAGIKKGTRSGLLYEVERLLQKAKETDTLPEYLLLENVKNLVGEKHYADFVRWLDFLKSLGYINSWQVLNAKDYGIPQNRERVFVVSQRKGFGLVFPPKIKLKLRLKDMIDRTVDDKYYLKESTINSILTSKYNSRRDSIRDPEGLAACLRQRDFHEPQCVKVGDLIGGKWDKVYKMSKRVFSPDGISPTVHCAGGGNTELKIVAMRGRNPENPSDRTAGGKFKQRFEENTKGTTNAITTVQKDNLVMEGNFVSRKYGEFIEKKGYIPEMFVAYNGQEIKDIGPTLQANAGQTQQPFLKVKVATKKGFDEATEGDYVNITYPGSNSKRGRVGKGVAHTLTTGDGSAVVTENIRIRKLTPKECWRLMGWADEQIDKVIACGMSNTQMYKQAGNGIVIQVLEAIFKRLFLEKSAEYYEQEQGQLMLAL